MKDNKPSKYRRGGISANLFALPLVVVISIIHIGLIMVIVDVNNASNELSTLMEASGNYQLDATTLIATNTVLSETSNAYIQMPVLPNGEANKGPLITYAAELDAEGRGPKVIKRFKEYGVSNEVLKYIEDASEYSEKMIDTQLHAMSLVCSVYPFPDLDQLKSIPLVELTEEEKHMPDEARLGLAKRLILTEDYSRSRYHINSDITGCNETLQKEFTIASEKTNKHVKALRRWTWLAISNVIIYLSLAFVFFYRLIIKPIRSYSEDIAADRMIKDQGGVYEMRQLVNSFNKMWKSRNKLESILRSAAENDALTGLPNRYCFERDMIKNEDSTDPYALLLFDVNYLKRTNDTLGHLAGDRLIQMAAKCISECVANENADNCYRIGGDEFVVLLAGATEEDVKARLKQFD